MTNLFKRNKTYYIRLSVNQDLQIYFDNKQTYIRSLQTHNINNAKIIVKYLLAKFNYIKRSIKMFTTQEIKEYIDKFKQINYDDIINRNSHLSIEQIDTQIKALNNNCDIYDEIIVKELYELMQIIDLEQKHEIDFGIDIDSANKFKKYIIQIKINALSDVKKTILNKVDISTSNTLNNAYNDDYITIKEAIEEFNNTRDSISEAQKKTSARDVNNFLEYCNIKNIVYLKNLKNKNLINYRTYLKKLNTKSKITTLNNALKNVIAFLNYCSDQANYINKITKNVCFNLTIKDKLEKQRSPYSNEDYAKILDNIDLIKRTEKTQKLNKYHKEYELIIKIAAHTGSRQNEICQLTKNDIKIEDNIYYFNFKIDLDEIDKKKLKTISSFRKVPIHFDIIDEVLAYTNTIKRDNLFTIKASKFSEDYGYFKTELGFGRSHVFHSFRNTLQNKLKQLKIQFEIINEIVGHGSEDENKITNDYTEKYDLHILHEALEQISYDEK